MGIQVAVVNSNSFGKVFKEHADELKGFAKIQYFYFPSTVTQSQLAESLQQFDAIVASVTPSFNADFFAQTPRLKLIARHGLGTNNVDLVSATEHHVAVTKVSPKVERIAVSEHAIALLLSLARRVPQANSGIRTLEWGSRIKFLGNELTNKTFGIIGLGNIGSQSAQILKNGFHGDILAYDPFIDEYKFVDAGAKKAELADLLHESDYILIHASLTPSSINLITSEEFGLMKSSVIIINTARGQILNQEALIGALKKKKIQAYAADVFETEPLPKNTPLFNFDNVILTPHIGAYTLESLHGMGDKMIKDLEAVVEGGYPTTALNYSELK